MSYHIFGEFPTATDAEIVSRKIKETVSDIGDIVITAKAIDSKRLTKIEKSDDIPYYIPESKREYEDKENEIAHEAYLEVYSNSYDAITKAGNIMTSLGGLKIYRDWYSIIYNLRIKFTDRNLRRLKYVFLFSWGNFIKYTWK